MPLFRRIHRNPDDDHSYSFASNPDPSRYEAVPEKADKSAKKAAEPVAAAEPKE